MRRSSPTSGRSRGLIGSRTARGSSPPRAGAVATRWAAVLGRGEDAKKVRDWLAAAAGVPGFIGFAVGRTVFWDPLVAWRAKKTTREAAVAEVARRYKEFVDLFDTARGVVTGRTE